MQRPPVTILGASAMRFTKMEGAGNDYVFVDLFEEMLPGSPHDLARSISDRHRGVGSDGLILIEPADDADAAMRIFNQDGSESEMCGNGIRCVALLLRQVGRTNSDEVTVRSRRGRHVLKLGSESPSATKVTVNMGAPVLDAAAIPTTLTGEPPLDEPLKVLNRELRVCCVSMGNPHCVLFCADVQSLNVRSIGTEIEYHSAFPNRTNVEFCEVTGDDSLRVRVWERGSGETRACGTGACAAVVAGVLRGLVSEQTKVELPGGNLEIDWSDRGDVMLTGPARRVFSGDWTP